jgi:DNA (cytosine-5)-methyltransferase 1
MKGLPDGWVTSPAIWEQDAPTPTPGVNVRAVPTGARNAQLKALGNGVVPQQAAAALHHLLDVHRQAVAA